MEAIKRKIRALFARAEHPTTPEEEASSCYAKAHELLAKFNLEQNQLGSDTDLVMGPATYSDAKWMMILAQAVSRLTSVGVVMTPGIRFAGRKMNVDMAQELLNHYVRQVNGYWDMARAPGLSSTERHVLRRNFREGAAQVVYHRVDAIIAANTRALIVSPVQLDKEMEEIFGNVRKESRSIAVRHNTEGTQAGAVAGHLIELSKEIKQND